MPKEPTTRWGGSSAGRRLLLLCTEDLEDIQVFLADIGSFCRSLRGLRRGASWHKGR